MTTNPTTRRIPWHIELIAMTICVFILSGLAQTFIGRIYVIPSGSMEPTLHGCTNCTNDKIYVNKLPTNKQTQPGQIIVFNAPDAWNTGYHPPRSNNTFLAALQDIGAFFGVVLPEENTLVKRIIATQGQTIRCLPDDPAIMVNNTPINDDYTLNPPERQPVNGSQQCGGKYFGPVTVPDNTVFVLGDNRTNSMDSRHHMTDSLIGAVPTDNIVGTVEAIVYPFNRVQKINAEPIRN